MRSKELKIGKLYEWEQPEGWEEEVFELSRLIGDEPKWMHNKDIFLYIGILPIGPKYKLDKFLDKDGEIVVLDETDCDCLREK